MRAIAVACVVGLGAVPLFWSPQGLTLPVVSKAGADRTRPSQGGGSGTGGGCVGCAVDTAKTDGLSAVEFDRWIARFAGEPADRTSLAFETLLFHGERTRAWIEVRGTGDLDESRRRALLRELARDRAAVSFRIVDEHGVERSRLDDRVVVLGKKAHLHCDQTGSLQAHEYGGRVQRVGLAHLWTRF